MMRALMVLAPLPALAAALAVLVGAPIAFDLPALRISLELDVPGAMLMGAAALLWIAAAIFAVTSGVTNRSGARFGVCWLLTLVGSLGVFVAADLLTFYLVFALVSLPAWGLVIHDEDAPAWRAGGVYMAFTVLSEALLLLGFVLLAVGEPNGSVQIHDVVAALPNSPWRAPAILFTGAGFALKIGLVPAHGWMPLSYAAAPNPAAAALSGAAVKAGVIGLIRFLPFDDANGMLQGAGEALVVLGLFSAFYGVALGFTQSNPKTVLAYSSISQMGVIATVLGMGLAAPEGGGETALAASFYAAHHVLAKGALFLAVGVIALTPASRAGPTLILAAIPALSLGGLPLSGGALAKLAVKAPLGDGLISTLGDLSAAGTTLLMLHFLMRLGRTAAQESLTQIPIGLTLPWRILAVASVIVPWLLYAVVMGPLTDALTLKALLASLWPVVVGAALAFALQRWRGRLPQLPAGDIVGAIERAFRASWSIGAAMDWADSRLRQWPAAGLSLLAIAAALGATILFGR